MQPPSKDYELPESLQDRELLIALLEAAWIPWGDSRYQDNPALAEARSKLQQTLEALKKEK